MRQWRPRSRWSGSATADTVELPPAGSVSLATQPGLGLSTGPSLPRAPFERSGNATGPAVGRGQASQVSSRPPGHSSHWASLEGTGGADPPAELCTIWARRVARRRKDAKLCTVFSRDPPTISCMTPRPTPNWSCGGAISCTGPRREPTGPWPSSGAGASMTDGRRRRPYRPAGPFSRPRRPPAPSSSRFARLCSPWSRAACAESRPGPACRGRPGRASARRRRRG